MIVMGWLSTSEQGGGVYWGKKHREASEGGGASRIKRAFGVCESQAGIPFSKTPRLRNAALLRGMNVDWSMRSVKDKATDTPAEAMCDDETRAHVMMLHVKVATARGQGSHPSAA